MDFESLKENSARAKIGAYKNINIKIKYIFENIFFAFTIILYILLFHNHLKT